MQFCTNCCLTLVFLIQEIQQRQVVIIVICNSYKADRIRTRNWKGLNQTRKPSWSMGSCSLWLHNLSSYCVISVGVVMLILPSDQTRGSLLTKRLLKLGLWFLKFHTWRITLSTRAQKSGSTSNPRSQPTIAQSNI